MTVDVVPVAQDSALDEFLRLPWRIYRGCRQWVPPVLDHQRKLFDRQTHPFHKHGDMQLFMARRDGKVAGRIAAIENRQHNEFHRDRTGFFGFFESVDDPEVAGRLLDAAAGWLRERKLDLLRGPISPSTNDESGLLIDGFDRPPVFMMAYNHPYYAGLLEGAGVSKVKDLHAYYVDRTTGVERRVQQVRRLAGRVRARPGVIIRRPDMSRFPEEIAAIRAIYGGAWEHNWGFVPMTEEEFENQARELKQSIVPDLARIATVDGRPAAFGILLPNYNEAFKFINGRLWPFGVPLIVAYYYLKRIRGLRLLAMGVVREHQKQGLEVAIMDELYAEIIRSHYQWCELSWTLEDNHLINNAIEAWGGQLYKRYRIYERAI